MSLAVWHWHIEISSKCTLQCPRCARTEVPDTLVNTELDLDFFKNSFDPFFIKKFVEKITFCGDDGDPIYAHDLIEVIKYFKSNNPNISIVIVTNGSYKSTEWWKDLALQLTDIDQVHFSIDGYDQESNNQYRKNSDWDSIIEGVKTLREYSNVFMSWDAIAFKFNEEFLNDMISLAKQYKFDQFQLTKSTKFGSKYEHYGTNDIYEPSSKFISSSHRFEREITNLSGKTVKEPWLPTNRKLYYQTDTINDIKPMCFIGSKGLYINSKGEFYPCCWVANRYNHNSEWFKLGKNFNLKENKLMDILGNSLWETDFTNISHECRMKCDRSVVNKNYATEW